MIALDEEDLKRLAASAEPGTKAVSLDGRFEWIRVRFQGDPSRNHWAYWIDGDGFVVVLDRIFAASAAKFAGLIMDQGRLEDGTAWVMTKGLPLRSIGPADPSSPLFDQLARRGISIEHALAEELPPEMQDPEWRKRHGQGPRPDEPEVIR